MADTNVVLRAMERGHPSRPAILQAIEELASHKRTTCTTPQVLVEAWAVMTRPQHANGWGLSPAAAQALLDAADSVFDILAADEAAVHAEWERIVRDHDVKGRQVYDARIVAAMRVHGLGDLLTLDKRFRRYGVNAIVPDVPKQTAADPGYPWFADLARTLNSGQSRSVLLHGPTHDLYFDGGRYVPLVPFLTGKCGVGGILQLVYELNGPIRILPAGGADKLRSAWVAWKLGDDPDALTLKALVDRRASDARQRAERQFDSLVSESAGSPTVALEFLRQLTIVSRATQHGRAILPEHLLIWIEAADLMLPGSAGEDITRLNPADRQRVVILRDWFGDPDFQSGGDSVVMMSESRGGVHRLVTALPQVLDVEVATADLDRRRHFLQHFADSAGDDAGRLGDLDALASATAGLSVQALRQLLAGAAYAGERVTPGDVTAKVESFIRGQLGEDVVEFKRPSHSLDDVVGATKLKEFLRDEFIPRVVSSGDDALPGAAVAGPIGAGKTFIFEAVAAELGVPVLTLKNIRSQWFGQTDVLFEQLRRTLTSLGRVVIFVDEADTAFGGLGEGSHETERRLTGKVQQMMSDPVLRGRVTWLLMTARIHRLSPDIRRPGRVGDLIIPVLDPTGQDRLDFVAWMLRKIVDGDPVAAAAELEPDLEATSAAAFASLRSRLKARANRDGPLSIEQVRQVAADFLPPAIGPTRRYQTLQALVNCTRRSLLPDPDATLQEREAWQDELRALEAQGIG